MLPLPNTHSPIARRLIVLTIFFSAIMAFIITGLHIYSDYKSGLHNVNESIVLIKATYLQSLKDSLWVIDDVQTNQHMNSLIKIPNIEYVTISVDGQVRWEAGQQKSSRVLTNIIAMDVINDGVATNLGDLTIVAGLDDLFSNLTEKALFTLIANSVKTFLVAIFMLFIVHYFVLRHIRKMVEYADKQSSNETYEPIILCRSKLEEQKSDELDQLVNAFNSMHQRLNRSHLKQEQYKNHLEEIVEKRTAEMEKARKIAVHANEAKSEFISRLSHEIRTPLNSIIGFSNLLKIKNEYYEENVQRVIDSGKHLLKIVNEMLDLSAIESGNIKLQPALFLIQDAVLESISIVKPLANDGNIEIVNTIGQKCNISVCADNMRLNQVLINLLSNAIKYNNEGGKVTVSCVEPTGDTVRIEVLDTGRGMSAEEQEMLFTPYNRFSPEQSNVEGTGIGMTITKKIIESMGGSIGVFSSDDGGCCFYIELPKNNKLGECSNAIA